LIKEFPTKGLKLRALNKLLRKLKDTGTTDGDQEVGDPAVRDKAIDEWRKRLRFCISAKGGHFKL